MTLYLEDARILRTYDGLGAVMHGTVLVSLLTSIVGSRDWGRAETTFSSNLLVINYDIWETEGIRQSTVVLARDARIERRLALASSDNSMSHDVLGRLTYGSVCEGSAHMTSADIGVEDCDSSSFITILSALVTDYRRWTLFTIDWDMSQLILR